MNVVVDAIEALFSYLIAFHIWVEIVGKSDLLKLKAAWNEHERNMKENASIHMHIFQFEGLPRGVKDMASFGPPISYLPVSFVSMGYHVVMDGKHVISSLPR